MQAVLVNTHLADTVRIISLLYDRILPQATAQRKPAGPTRSLARARFQKKGTTDKYKSNDPVKNFASSLRSDDCPSKVSRSVDYLLL